MKRVLWSEDGTGEPAGKIVAMVTHAAHPCPLPPRSVTLQLRPQGRSSAV